MGYYDIWEGRKSREDLAKNAPRSGFWLYQYNSTLICRGDKGRFVDKANDLLEVSPAPD